MKGFSGQNYIYSSHSSVIIHDHCASSMIWDDHQWACITIHDMQWHEQNVSMYCHQLPCVIISSHGLSPVIMHVHQITVLIHSHLMPLGVTSLNFLWPCTWLIISGHSLPSFITSGHGDWTWCLSPLVSCHHLLQITITYDNSSFILKHSSPSMVMGVHKSSSLIMGDHGWLSFSKAEFSKISMICPGCPFIVRTIT